MFSELLISHLFISFTEVYNFSFFEISFEYSVLYFCLKFSLESNISINELLFNFISSIIYTKGLSLRERIQPFLIAVIFLIFFLLTAIVQIKAFLRGHTPLPHWCWVFSVLFGLAWAVLMRLIGDYGLTNALATGWISIGNLWMMGGLLVMSGKVRAES